VWRGVFDNQGRSDLARQEAGGVNTCADRYAIMLDDPPDHRFRPPAAGPPCLFRPPAAGPPCLFRPPAAGPPCLAMGPRFGSGVRVLPSCCPHMMGAALWCRDQPPACRNYPTLAPKENRVYPSNSWHRVVKFSYPVRGSSVMRFRLYPLQGHPSHTTEGPGLVPFALKAETRARRRKSSTAQSTRSILFALWM
jgi:hypothetical protein